jgi:Phage P22-like portal protein
MTDFLTEARREWKETCDVREVERRIAQEDLRFSDPIEPDQWEPEARAARNTDAGMLPCLTIDRIGRFEQNVAGGLDQNPPAMTAVAVDGGKKDKRLALAVEGLLRHTENASRAGPLYSRLQRSACRTGVGYGIVLPEVIDYNMGYQEPRLHVAVDVLSCGIDPYAKSIAGEDANWATWLVNVPRPEFIKTYPKADQTSFGAHSESQQPKSDESGIIVARHWRAIHGTEKVAQFQLPDGSVTQLTLDKFELLVQQVGPIDFQEIERPTKVVRWALMSGADLLEDESIYPASYVGVVPMYAYLHERDGLLSYVGMYRKARVGQQLYNYHASELQRVIGQQAKAPWWVAEESVTDPKRQAQLDRMAVDYRAWLAYKSRTASGEPIPPPFRIDSSADISMHVIGMQQADDQIQNALGMNDASLGLPSNETSGRAIAERKAQASVQNTHFTLHANATIAQLARICTEMHINLTDTRRYKRIMGADGGASQIIIDPDAPESAVGQDDVVVLSKDAAKYDIVVRAGQSYSTQQEKTSELLRGLVEQNSPQGQIASVYLMRQSGLPEADKMAEAMAMTLPPEVRAVVMPSEQDQGPSKAELAKQVDELKQALKSTSDAAQEAQQEILRLKDDVADKTAEIGVKSFDADTKRLVAVGAAMSPDQVQALVMQTVNDLLTQRLAQTVQQSAQPQPMQPQLQQVQQPQQPQQVMP